MFADSSDPAYLHEIQIECGWRGESLTTSSAPNVPRMARLSRCTCPSFQFRCLQNRVKNIPTESEIQNMAMTALPAFTYDRHLHDPRAKTIRVLELQPSLNQADILQLQLHYADLEDPEVCYEAISYSWDGQIATEDVLCNGLHLKITQTLYNAFKSLRNPESTRYVWADAVCINQADVEEKNNQVPLMREIYQKADIVKVWLGRDDTGIGGTVCRLLTGMSQVTQLWDDIDPSDRHMGSGRLVALGVPPGGDPSWNALPEFLCISWFSRTWVIQEVALPKKAEFLFGLHTIPWRTFAEAIQTMFRLQLLLYTSSYGAGQSLPDWRSSEASSRFLLMAQTRSACILSQRHNVDLIQLLSYARSAKATDPKDKIYALLGLATRISGVDVLVPVNYSSEFLVEALYVHVAKLALDCKDTLDILSVPPLVLSPSSRRLKLPSWVPDWSYGAAVTQILSPTDCLNPEYEIEFDAARTSTSPKQFRVVGNSLELHGLIFDVIDLVTAVEEQEPSLPPLVASHPERALLVSYIHSVHGIEALSAMAKTARYGTNLVYPTGESIEDAYLWTLFLGRPDLQGPVHLQDVDLLRRWYKFATTGTTCLHVLRSVNLHRQPYAMAALGWCLGLRISLFPPRDLSLEDISHLYYLLFRSISRRLVRTRKGYIGLANPTVKPGDSIALVRGGRMPLIVRERPGKDNTWELVGDAYVHGIMYGEAFDEQKCERIIIE